MTKEPEESRNDLEKAAILKNKMEQALQESEEKYRTLLEHIPVGIFRSTPGPRGRFLEVNEAYVKMLGYQNKEELLTIDVALLYQNEEDRIKFSEKLSKHGFVKNEIAKLKKKDGTPILVNETAIAVGDNSGAIQYFYGILEDITKQKKAEEDLLIQKTYFEKLFNSAPEAIVLNHSKDFIVNVNEEFTKMFGYTLEEAIGRPINELVASDDQMEEASQISERVISGERIEIETKRKRKDGTLFDVSILGAPIIYEGEQIGDYAIYRDITKRKKAEEELLIQMAFKDILFNSAPEAIVLHDQEDCVMNINDEFTRMFGYTRVEAIGRPINELVASDECLDEAADLSNKVIHGEIVEVESQRKHKDGTLMDVTILGAPIFHDGEQMGVYAIYRDITKRKKAEEELILQKTYLENLFNSAPEAIVLHDNNDRIVNVNEEFTKMFGYTREEAIGRPINELVASGEFLDEASSLSEMVINGEKVEIDTKRRRKDGTLFDVWILGAPVIHKGNQMGVYAIYRDITERKKAEEARIRREEEARTARNIQMNFLPKSNPEIPGYDIAGKSLPALNVGGDYYDFIWLDDHRLAIGLGDVSGNGLPASLVMANLQATIRGQALLDIAPEECLARANKFLVQSTDVRTFITLFYGILDTKENRLYYSSAGQNLPVLFSHEKKPVQLQTRGMALGIQQDVSYEREEIPVNPGDRLLIYSDGIPEAMNHRMEEFGDEKLIDLVSRNRQDSSSVLIERVITEVEDHCGNAPQHDDMTMVILSRIKK
jgi:sigma-B regulation protein RsbU (phosphoserine phosphatase)